MTFPNSSLLERLEIKFRSVCEMFKTGQNQVVSLSIAAPEIDFSEMPKGLTGAHFWANPKDSVFLLGIAKAVSFCASGNKRFRGLSAYHAELKNSWKYEDPDNTGLTPILFTGFSFAPDQNDNVLPNSSLHLPVLTLQAHNGVVGLTFSWDLKNTSEVEVILGKWKTLLQMLLVALNEPVCDKKGLNPLIRLDVRPNNERWLKTVDKALNDIQAGIIEKVVLTRQLNVKAERDFDIASVLSELTKRYPQCVQIAQPCEKGVIVAATPERLINLKNRIGKSDALAGTQRRYADMPHNAELFRSVKQSPKDLHEHQLVVDSILKNLMPMCERIEASNEPQLLELRSLEHLWTPISAHVKDAITLLDLASALHPTPAVGGVPRDVALDWLAQNEENRFGWYTGAFGWMTPSGDGDLSVILRCAYLQDKSALLSAGAGIVKNSTPQNELDEIELKFQVMLEVLEVA